MQRGSLNQIVALGMGQFVWRYGVVWFGGLYFFATAVTRWAGIDPAYRHDVGVVGSLAAMSLVYSFSLGAVCGFVGWFVISILARRPEKRTRNTFALHGATVPADLGLEPELARTQAAGTNK